MTHPIFALDDPIIALDWSPDGRHVAVAGIGGECAIVDGATLQPAHRFFAHKGGALALSWSPKGDVVASAGQDGTLRLWLPDSAAMLRELNLGIPAWVEHVAFSPNGDYFAASAGRRLRVWKASGELVLSFDSHESTVSSLRWRADSKGVATACYGKIRCFRLGETKPYEVLDWKASLIALAWSPNGRCLASSTQENTIQFFRLPSAGREPLQMSGYPVKVRNLSWDRTARYLASGGGEMITLWDVSGGGPAGTIPLQLSGHPQNIMALEFQRRGDLLVSGCQGGAVFVWNPSQCPWPRNEPAPTDQRVCAFRLRACINQLRWSPCESRVAIGCQDGTVMLRQISNPVCAPERS